MSDTPTDPREIKPVKLFLVTMRERQNDGATETVSFRSGIYVSQSEAHAKVAMLESRQSGFAVDELDAKPFDTTFLTAQLESTNSKLAAEVERQNVILLSHFKAVGEFACGAPSVPDALRKLAADLKNALDGQEYYKNEADVAAERLAKLAAELEALKTSKRPFSDKLAGEVIDSQVKRITELETKLSANIVELDELEAKYDELHGIHVERLTELEAAKRTLFQTEKRLDDKLRTALAELEAARKELRQLESDYDDVGDARDTALAAKDAAEKALVRIASMEPHQHSSTCMLMHKIANEARAALTPAPTQEPPACPKCFGTGWIRQVGGKLKCECKQNPTGDDDGLFDNIPDFQAIGGVTISNETVGIIPTATTPTKASSDVSTLGAEAASHHISTEKKGGDEPCASQIVPSVSNSKPSNVLKTGPIGASNSPADVPSEGRGECSMCHGFGWIRIGDPGLRCQCKTRLPFNLSDALAGKPVVTRDGQSVRYEDCVNNIILAWIGDTRMMWWDNGKFTHRSEPDPLDLFMLPTEGSGA